MEFSEAWRDSSVRGVSWTGVRGTGPSHDSSVGAATALNVDGAACLVRYGVGPVHHIAWVASVSRYRTFVRSVSLAPR